MNVSQRVENLSFSATIKIADKVRELEQKGEKIINLSAGESNFTTPQKIKDAAIKAICDDQTYYSHSKGLVELRRLIADKYNRTYGISLDFDKNILITPGGKQAILYLIMALAEQNDEVIIPVPSWGSYVDIVKLAGATPVLVECDKAKNFEISVDAIEMAISTKTKIIILNSPNNPTGRLINKDILEEINKLCLAHDIFLLSDEIYDQIVFTGYQHDSIVPVNPRLKNCALLNGFSKAYSMTGWRLGYIIAEVGIIGAMLKIQQNSIACPTTFAQYGAIEALKNGEEFTQKALKSYEENISFIVSEFKKLKRFKLIPPQGSFYAFIDVSDVNNDSGEFCLDLLEKCKISAVPGFAFGGNGEGHIRICLATKKENLIEFVKRITEAYENTSSIACAQINQVRNEI